jgi:5-methylcytosine-specific restriction endonuclease McrA
MVVVVDAQKRPLAPCHPSRARRLVTEGKAAVWRHYPFTIILKRAVLDALPEPLRLTIDPGNRTTGLALVNDRTGRVAWAAELAHRGHGVRDALVARRVLRRNRRQRKTRYRPRRFDTRCRPDGWLPPALQSRVANVLTWGARLSQLAPVAAVSQELARFDIHRREHPAISGAQYQQGTLAGDEVREYPLEKLARMCAWMCAYCGATGLPLHVEHIVPRVRGGSNHVSNLTIACEPCHQAKGSRTAEAFGHPEVQAHAQRPLNDAAAVNASRWAVYRRLQASRLPVQVGTGGRTKWNRTQRGLPKMHWLAAAGAAGVGGSTRKQMQATGIVPVLMAALGRHSRQMCRTNSFGFADTTPQATSVVAGMRTGDLVRAVVPAPSIKAGTYVGRLAVRATGSCTTRTIAGTVQGIHIRYCRPFHRGDGYSYEKGAAALRPAA